MGRQPAVLLDWSEDVQHIGLCVQQVTDWTGPNAGPVMIVMKS